jgi:biopolymer transport protein ExbB
MIDDVAALLRDGGSTVPPLLVMALLLWYSLGVRWAAIREVSALAGTRLSAFEASRLRQELQTGLAPVTAVVLTAPLLGLLGTVGGMIETFDSLATMELFSRSGGVAGGIAEALLSTQVGLVVAIPGAIVGRLMTRRAEAIADRLAEVES